MTYKSHVNFALISVLAYNYFSKDANSFLEIADLLVWAGLGSLTPDLDSGSSILSNIIYKADDLLRKYHILEHRKIAHLNFKFSLKWLVKLLGLKRKSLVAKISKGVLETKNFTAMMRWLMCFLIIYVTTFQSNLAITGFAVGYVSHIVIDYAMSWINVKTGSDIENKIIYPTLGKIFCGSLVLSVVGKFI